MLPRPRAQLAGCCWLPRFADKARRIETGALPPDYAARFCAPDSVDFYFLQHFGLAKEVAIQGATACRTEKELAAWFSSLPGVDADRIAAWNTAAERLGQPGQPMEERFRSVLASTYAHLDHRRIRSIFDVIEADEAGGT